MQKDQ